MRTIIWTVIFTIAAGLPGSSAFAQGNDPNRDIERPSYAAEKSKRVTETAEQASDQSAEDKITYADVMKDPDNIELNYKFAKTQIADGNVRGAAATLERILMVDPALPKVRLLYAVVLYRLDSLREAQKELLALKELPMPDSLRAEIDEYLSRIQKRLRKTNFKTLFGIGFQHDSNRNSAPDDNQRLLGGNPVTLTSGRQQGDQALIAISRIRVDHDLGTQAGHSLFGEFNFYRAEQTELDSLDFEAYSWDMGFTYKTSLGEFSPAGIFTYAQLDNVAYLRSRGARVAWEKTKSRRVKLFAHLSSVFQEFIVSPSAPTADERTGGQTDFAIGMNYLISPKQRLTGSFLFRDKDARMRYNAYQRKSFTVRHAMVLPLGMFMLTGATLNFDTYDRADTAASDLVRRDDTVRIGPTIGAPLGFIAKPLKSLIWTVSYEYYYSDSNIISYDYTNHQVNSMLTYTFDF